MKYQHRDDRELSKKAFKGIIKILQWAINEHGTHEETESLSKGLEYIKKEPNENFGTEKHNSQSKKLNGWVQQQNGRAEERISELEDRTIGNYPIWPTERKETTKTTTKKTKKKPQNTPDPKVSGICRTTIKDLTFVSSILEGEEKEGKAKK